MLCALSRESFLSFSAHLISGELVSDRVYLSKLCLSLPSSCISGPKNSPMDVVHQCWNRVGICHTDLLFRENTNGHLFLKNFFFFLGGLLYAVIIFGRPWKKKRTIHSTRTVTSSSYFVWNHHCSTRNRRPSPLHVAMIILTHQFLVEVNL